MASKSERNCAVGKTLYVTDLDGTLMRNDETISAYTIETINGLIDKGLAFTYATARSIESARPIAGGLHLHLPAITRNGAVLADNATGKHLEKATFSEDEVALLMEMLPELPKYGFVSCFLGEEMHRLYLDCEHTPALQGYFDYYAANPTVRPVPSFAELFCGEPGYVTLIGAKEEIRPIYERVREYKGWETLFQKDTYRDEFWLEICPQNCTKAKTIRKVAEKYGFDRLVVFGDGINDIPMFEIADEAYAVSNALPELKQHATGIIGCNEEDAVANYLKERTGCLHNRDGEATGKEKNGMKRFGCAINYFIVDLLNIWKDSSPETFAARRDEYLVAANASADSPFRQLDYTRMTKMADFIKRRVDSITCENEMKMEIFFREEQPAFIDDEVNTALFDFSYADRIYAFACEHGLDIRIHTVLWYNHVPRQLKEYLAGRNEADRKRLTLAFLKAFMQCLRERYPKGYCVDVINEMAADPDELRYMAEEGEPGYEYDEDGIRIDFWYRTLGKDYYLEVLRLAREVFGDDVKLVYNDNNEGNREKQKTVQTVVDKCKTYERETGIRLLDALGMQCHFWGSKEETKEFMEQFFAFYRGLGLELQVTEFDVSNHSTKEIQERIFRDFIEVAPKYGVENFTMWALNDLVSWYAADEPTLVDRDGNEKPVAAKYVEAFSAKRQ